MKNKLLFINYCLLAITLATTGYTLAHQADLQKRPQITYHSWVGADQVSERCMVTMGGVGVYCTAYAHFPGDKQPNITEHTYDLVAD